MDLPKFICPFQQTSYQNQPNHINFQSIRGSRGVKTCQICDTLDWSRDTTGPLPLDGAQTHLEQLAWQTRSCPQSSKILLELPWWTLHWWWPPLQGWMSGHSTILQRWYHGRPPWKPCQYQQSNGPGQNMYLLAQHGSRCDWLHQAVPHIHWVQQSTSWDAETPWGPPQTLGKNRCWLLSRPFGKKAPNSGRLLQQVPIRVSSGIYTSFQDHHSLEETLCSWRYSCCCHVWQWTSLQWRRI